MLDAGFVPLAGEPGVEVVAGVVAAPWKIGGTPVAVSDARGFVAFEEPGYMKGAMNFSVAPSGGGAELRTETRVLTTDPASRRAFGRYWSLVRFGSAEVRRGWLRAARRRAEAEALAPQAGSGAGPEANGGLGFSRVVLAAVFFGAGTARLALPKDRLRLPIR